MSTPILVIDSHYLCHRAWHTSGSLSFQGQATGTIFGFLKSITAFMDQFSTDRIVFCFEHPHLLRRDIFPDYKIRRIKRDISQQEAKERILFHGQIAKLREEYLPKIGFKNVFCFDGFESDDIMAVIARDLPQDEEAILVTSDGDLFQCLRQNAVSIYSPQKRKLLTETWFTNQYGIHPRSWAKVKAIAGCGGDGVPGIKGIGEKTALRFVQGAEITSRNTGLIQAGKEMVMRNRQLVQLPYVGCPSPKLVPDAVSVKGWQAVCAELGMRSLAGQPPVSTRRAR